MVQPFSRGMPQARHRPPLEQQGMQVTGLKIRKNAGCPTSAPPPNRCDLADPPPPPYLPGLHARTSPPLPMPPYLHHMCPAGILRPDDLPSALIVAARDSIHPASRRCGATATVSRGHQDMHKLQLTMVVRGMTCMSSRHCCLTGCRCPPPPHLTPFPQGFSTCRLSWRPSPWVPASGPPSASCPVPPYRRQ